MSIIKRNRRARPGRTYTSKPDGLAIASVTTGVISGHMVSRRNPATGKQEPFRVSELYGEGVSAEVEGTLYVLENGRKLTPRNYKRLVGAKRSRHEVRAYRQRFLRTQRVLDELVKKVQENKDAGEQLIRETLRDLYTGLEQGEGGVRAKA